MCVFTQRDANTQRRHTYTYAHTHTQKGYSVRQRSTNSMIAGLTAEAWGLTEERGPLVSPDRQHTCGGTFHTKQAMRAQAAAASRHAWGEGNPCAMRAPGRSSDMERPFALARALLLLVLLAPSCRERGPLWCSLGLPTSPGFALARGSSSSSSCTSWSACGVHGRGHACEWGAPPQPHAQVSDMRAGTGPAHVGVLTASVLQCVGSSGCKWVMAAFVHVRM